MLEGIWSTISIVFGGDNRSVDMFVLVLYENLYNALNKNQKVGVKALLQD